MSPSADQVGRDLERRRGTALADPGLQEPQPAVLHGELDVAQVAVVLLEGGQVLEELAVQRRARGSPSSLSGMVVRLPFTTSSPCASGR